MNIPPLRLYKSLTVVYCFMVSIIIPPSESLAKLIHSELNIQSSANEKTDNAIPVSNGDFLISDLKEGIFLFSVSDNKLHHLLYDDVREANFGDVEWSARGDIIFVDRGVFRNSLDNSPGTLYQYSCDENTIKTLFDFKRGVAGVSAAVGNPEGIYVRNDGQIFVTARETMYNSLTGNTYSYGCVFTSNPYLNVLRTEILNDQNIQYYAQNRAGYPTAICAKDDYAFFVSRTIPGYVTGIFLTIKLDDNTLYHINQEFIPYHPASVKEYGIGSDQKYWLVADNDLETSTLSNMSCIYILNQNEKDQDGNFTLEENLIYSGDWDYISDIAVDEANSKIYAVDQELCKIYSATMLSASYIFQPAVLLSLKEYNPALSSITGIALVQGIQSRIGDEPHNHTPFSFELKQNYPNPFNPVTTIGYSIESPCQVELSIYNISGQLIEIFSFENVAPGQYQIQWNAAKHPNGIYFCELRAGDFVDMKKMIFMK